MGDETPGESVVGCPPGGGGPAGIAVSGGVLVGERIVDKGQGIPKHPRRTPQPLNTVLHRPLRFPTALRGSVR